MSPRYFGLIPAAGSGERFADGLADVPKQYRALGSGQRAQPMLMHAVSSLLAAPEIETVFVVLAPADRHFRSFDWSSFGTRVEPLYCGGGTRRDSVLNGLVAMSGAAEPEDWVLVHDAARPCLQPDALRRLIDVIMAGAEISGGILALPVADTLKRGDSEDCITGTESREGLWQAQTPQMFRHALLMRALLQAAHVTDEAAAIERLGLRPRLVKGSARNIKVTVPEDLALAQLIVDEA